MLLHVGSFFMKIPLEFCVDKKISSVKHYIAAVLALVRTECVYSALKKHKKKNNGLTYSTLVKTLRRAGTHQMIEAGCSPK